MTLRCEMARKKEKLQPWAAGDSRLMVKCSHPRVSLGSVHNDNPPRNASRTSRLAGTLRYTFLRKGAPASARRPAAHHKLPDEMIITER